MISTYLNVVCNFLEVRFATFLYSETLLSRSQFEHICTVNFVPICTFTFKTLTVMNEKIMQGLSKVVIAELDCVLLSCSARYSFLLCTFFKLGFVTFKVFCYIIGLQTLLYFLKFKISNVLSFLLHFESTGDKRNLVLKRPKYY